MLDEEKGLNGYYLLVDLVINVLNVHIWRISHAVILKKDVMQWKHLILMLCVLLKIFFNVTSQWITKDSRPDYHIFLNLKLF